MQIKNTPIQQKPIEQTGYFTRVWSAWLGNLKISINSILTRLGAIEDAIGSARYDVFSQMPEQVPDTDQGILWIAEDAGTQNGQAYERGDLIFTGNSDGVEKTIIIIDWSSV